MRKVFFGILAIVFGILAIVFYNKSIVKAGYGHNTMEVANIQMTVFAAASAVLCGVNIVGALLSSELEKKRELPQKQLSLLMTLKKPLRKQLNHA